MSLSTFQNQSSWLQYIKNLKNPIPMIESPGFPGKDVLKNKLVCTCFLKELQKETRTTM